MKKNNNTHIKLGDRVQVISGGQKGVIGTITAIQKKKKTVILDTVPTRTKMTKAREGEESKKIDLPTLIHWSNVMLWDETMTCASRIGYKEVEGKKLRYLKTSNTFL